ncbi:MAG: PA14 domain-containing protein, partial [Planctomycetota bacterium]
MYRRLICLVSLVLMPGLVGTNVAFGGKVWESRVSSGNDDAEEDVSGGGIDLSSSDLEMLDDGGLQVIGLRFVDVPIPKGAIIDDAFIEFTCDETKSGTQPVSLLIEGELSPDTVTFANVSGNITSRPTTTANVIWVPANWTEVGQKDQTSDITSIIQEIVDQDGWASGNALAIIIRDDPDNPSQGIRCAESASDKSNAPLLHIEFRGKFAVEPIPADGGLYEDTSAVLSWLPGLNAVSHDVYFSENLADVEAGTPGAPGFQGNQVETFFTVGIAGTPVPDGLVPGTTYYWRIDEIEADGVTINRGDVWSFTVPSRKAYNHSLSDGACFVSPYTDLSWTPGSGAKIHTVFFGDNFDDVNSAVVGIQQATETYDPGPLESDKTYYWRVDEFDGVETHRGDVLSFTTIGERGTGLRGRYYSGQNFDKLELTRTDTQIDFPWGGNPPDDKLGGSDFSVRWTGDVSAQFTDTYTFYTITDDGIRVWVNGELIIENWTHHGDTEDRGTIDLVAGRHYSIEIEYFQAGGGSIAQLGWESPHTTKQLIPTDLLWPPVRARNPKPLNGTVGVRLTDLLTWTPGEHAASHDVYFGTDEDAVRNAGKAAPEYKGSKALGDERYDPGKLAWDTTYYWRVDEVNDANPDSPWAGSLWSFATGDFLVVDDFESYDDIDPLPGETGGNRIFDKWIDGFGTTTNGALVGNDLPPYAERTIVHGGAQSMPYFYDNADKTSEATLTLVYPRDWTEQGVTKLSLWFRGASANAADRMFV